ESPTHNETIVDKEESSKHGRKIADIDVDADVKLENVYNLDMAHEETVLIARRIETEWNADIKDNIDWNEVVEQV
nr:hypothetical protein [Tanacetum cinerariifolium]